MNYQRNWVLAAYRAQYDTRRNPTAGTLDNYDQGLFEDYDEELQRQQDATIPLNKFNRSILVYFASRSLAENPETQVKHAYEFFRSTKPRP